MPRVTATGICEKAEFMIFAMRKFCVFTPEYVWVKCFLVPFDFSARVCGEKILNMQWGFLFHELPAICHEKDLCVFLLRTVL